MDRSFDLVALLKQQPTTKSHKIRPTQFVSVAGGVQKRLETNIKNRKSCRLTFFDRIRNISKCESPKAPALSDAQQKAIYRKQQLEKWKEEKEKKKKEAAGQKKKPFITGLPQRRTFGPPPPAKPVPSTSGRVTRSQARQKIEPKPATAQTKSFAPSNASFKPQFLNLKAPTLAPVTKKKNKAKPNITFEPVLPNTSQKVETRATRAKPVTNKPVTDSKIIKPNEKTKAKGKNLSLKPPPLKQHMFQSSSSSDMEEKATKLRTKPSLRKSLSKTMDVTQESTTLFQSSSSSDMEEKATKLRTKPSLRKSLPKTMDVTQESTTSEDSAESEVQISDSASMSQESASSQDESSSSSSSSSEEKLRSPRNFKLTPEQIIEEARNISPCVTMSRGKDNARKEMKKKLDEGLLDWDNSKMESVDHFRRQLDSEIARITATCDAWDIIFAQTTLPEPVQDESQRTPKNKVPRSESSSEEKLRSPRNFKLTPEQIIEEATNISPCVTMSRGKDNARKEMKKKLDEGLLDWDNSKMESVDHFRRQLDSEIARITATCDAWDIIFAQTTLPEPVQELVLTAVGQARLLMSQKMQQFAGLVERCARPTPGSAVVTPADLHGFWDMVFMQVEDVDMRFKKLEELRLRDWIEEQQPKARKVVAKPAAKKVAKPSGPSVPSRLREMIAAARKAKKDQESQPENTVSEKSEPTASECKTFEAGFFRVSSPVKRGSPAPATPNNKGSLLKCVLTSEARKSVSKNSTSFAMLRASVMSKNVDIDGVSPLMQSPPTIILTPVNLEATPARSILKQKNPVSEKTNKFKTVLFHESDTEASSPQSYTSCVEPSVTGVVPLPAEDKEYKGTPRRRSRLSRQDAEERLSPVMTRSRRRSMHTPLVEADANVEARRSVRRPKEAEPNVLETETPKRSTRRRKSAAAV